VVVVDETVAVGQLVAVALLSVLTDPPPYGFAE